MTNAALLSLLKRKKACPEAVAWVGTRDLVTAWRECERADWMLWFCGIMAGTKNWPTWQQVVLVMCTCARQALRFVPAGENRPLAAIEAAEVWAKMPTTGAAARAAGAAGAAEAAAGAAWAAAGAGRAAWAAAGAAGAAGAARTARAGWAAWAAEAAARAAWADGVADWAAGEAAGHKILADLVRKLIPRITDCKK